MQRSRPGRRARAVTVLVLGLAIALGIGAGPAAPSAAAAVRPFGCLPVNGLSSRFVNDPERLMSGVLHIPGFRAVTIGTGAPDWGLDPFGSPTWRRYFLSLKWVESLTDAYSRTHDTRYLARATALVASFAARVPAGGGRFAADAWTPMYAGQRATVYTCVESRLGSRPAWLEAALRTHGGWLAAHDPGDWNQGVDAAIGLLAAACRTGTTPWASLADARFARMATSTIDPEGMVMEQAPGYGSYLLARWKVAADKLAGCGRAVPPALATRLPLAREFLAWSTNPAGRTEQLGDTLAVPAEAPGAADALGFAVSRGASGAAPGGTTRLYTGGYLFGRSAWAGFGTSDYWTLRFGPGRAFHGHEDHTSLTWTVAGDPLLVDSGHVGYTAGAYRDHLVGPWAHNVVVGEGTTFAKRRPTRLVRTSSGTGWTFAQLTGSVWDRRARTRAVLVDDANDTLVVLDAVSRAGPGAWHQLWHLPPGTRVTVSGRTSATALTSSGRTQLRLLQVPLPGQRLPVGSTSVVAGANRPMLGWVSTAQGSRRAAPVVRMSRLDRTVRILTVLVAGDPGSQVGTRVRPRGAGYTIDVTVDGSTTSYGLSPGGALYR